MINDNSVKSEIQNSGSFHASTLIVGGGISGLYMASRLADAGIDCVILEAGSAKPIGDWRDLSWYVEGRDRVDVDAPFPYNEKFSWVKALGGSTEAWEGYTPRWADYDFKTASEFGIGLDWPLSYSDLERYYCRAEAFLGVAGIDDNPHDEYRSKPFPLPEFEFDEYESNIISRAKQYNWHHVPQARNSRAYRGRSHCNTVATCNSCPIQARWSPSATLLPKLRRNKRVHIITDSSCLEIIPDNENRAVKARVHSEGIGEWLATFDNLILAAGAVETSRLLLNSRERSPHGFLNDSGLVGRGYMDHPVIRVKADPEWTFHKQVEYNILASTHDYRKYDSSRGSWGFVTNLNSRAKGKIWVAAHFEMPALLTNQVVLSPERIDKHGIPMADIRIKEVWGNFDATIEHAKSVLEDIAISAGGSNLQYDPFQLWACHPMGGCMISATEGEGVVNPELRAWESENTYILSNGVFCSGAAVNPTLTLLALGMRLAEKLTKE